MKETVEPIHLAIAFDDQVLTPVYVLLTSIFHHHAGHGIVIHAIANQVEPGEKARIQEYVQRHHAQIHYYDVDSAFLNSFTVLPAGSHYTASAYSRLLFPALLSQEIEKIIYLDVDTIVIGDLRELQELNVGSFPVAASVDVGMFHAFGEHGKYFNSGVMLINLAEWRKQEVTERTVRYLAEFSAKIKYADQDALNEVLRDNWLKIDSRFNVTSNDIPRFLVARDYGKFLQDKVIIHYTGKDKPWLVAGRNRLKFLYHQYLKRSPRASERKYADFKLNYRCLAVLLQVRVAEFLRRYPKLFNFLRSKGDFSG